MKSMLLALALSAFTAAAFGQAAPEAPTRAWYPFHPTNTAEPGEIGMQSWSAAPAGAHGRITMSGEKLLYNGEPIHLWGLNLCYGACVPDKALADRRAAFYGKYGMNAVRLHKFTESDYAAGDSAVDISPEGIDRMDYQVAQFKKHGIYTTLSVHFGPPMLGPADRKYVPWIDEIGSFDKVRNRKAPRISAAHSALFYSPELQELHIQQMLALLKHKNSYTGETYAHDPAIAFIEIVNEQSIFWGTSMDPLRAYPTLRKQVGARFSDWLKAKYGSQEGLMKAWGAKAFDTFESKGFAAGENLDRRNILPLGAPWYWEHINDSQQFQKQRLLDTLEFLHMLQSECYERYVKAVRGAGYDGEILGSNWQAGSGVSHFANLHTDYEVGTIDRHNYFGGGAKQGAPFHNGSMLAKAGSGLLSTGLQQVIDRPFMMSEWIHVYPNEWGVEGPAILGAYGLGLQGWDASFMFQNRDNGTFSDRIGREVWDVTAPQVFGVFPAVARQVRRGDVRESPVVAVQNVNMPAVFAGKLDADAKVQQGYDEKEISSRQVPAQALAVARTAVAFTDKPEATPTFDLKKYEDGGTLVSSTSELRWTPGDTKTSGYFTMDTAATKAVVGFANGKTLTLGDVTITPQSRFAAIYLTAQGPDETLASAHKIVVVALARARNVGMKFNAAEDEVIAQGQGGILLEPVHATIKLGRAGPVKVTVLTQDGLRTERTIAVKDGAFTIDGTRDQTPYYLIEYP